jgi:hypothetical protein
MCHRVTCRTCNKPTYRGCGMHVEQVLAGVPKSQRCSCDRTRKPPAGACSRGCDAVRFRRPQAPTAARRRSGSSQRRDDREPAIWGDTVAGVYGELREQGEPVAPDHGMAPLDRPARRAAGPADLQRPRGRADSEQSLLRPWPARPRGCPHARRLAGCLRGRPARRRARYGSRTPEPHPGLESQPSAADPARVSDPPQPARPHRSLDGAAPLNPLPEPIDLEHYRAPRQARTYGLINEYRLVT